MTGVEPPAEWLPAEALPVPVGTSEEAGPERVTLALPVAVEPLEVDPTGARTRVAETLCSTVCPDVITRLSWLAADVRGGRAPAGADPRAAWTWGL